MPTRPRTLLDQVQAILRRQYYSLRTETRYLAWIKRYIHPPDPILHLKWAFSGRAESCKL